MNHFELLGLPQQFPLDDKLLDERFRALSGQWHPDKFAGADAKQRIQALEMTSRINDAYKTLRDPALRSAYLLKLLGVDLDAEGEATHQMDPAFLMEILDKREALDAAKTDKDVDGALKLGAEIIAREKETLARLEKMFAEQLASPDHAKLGKLADQVAALRYFRRFHDEVSAIEESQSS